MQPEFVIGLGMLLFGLLLVVALVSFKNTLVSGPGRKVSLVSLGLFIGTLGCIAALNDPKTMEPRTAFLLTCFAIIPTCVVVASMFAVSFLEPLLMASGLFLIPLVADFMPNVSGPRNLWRTPPLAESGPVFNVLLLTTVYVVPLSIIGFGALHARRKVRTRQWVWSALRGLAWGIPCGVGVMIAVKRKMALDIAFGGDYTMVWVILGTFVAVTAIAGLKRNPHAVQSASEPAGRADGGAPLGSAPQQGMIEISAADNRSGGAATQSALDRPIVHKRRMVSGAKCGLILLCLYVIFMGLVVVQPEPVRRIFRRMPDALGYALVFGLPILVGIAGLITGIQKKRPGIGVLALLTTPIGFFFALAAENRSGSHASSSLIRCKRPIGVTVVGSALMVLSAFRLLTTFVPITANNHVLRMLSMSVIPVDPGDVYSMVSAFNGWPFSFLGARVFGYGSLVATLLIGVFLLLGIRWARWLYLGWGALGILAALTSLYFPPGYIVIRVLIFVAFTVVLSWKNSSEFFSRQKKAIQPRQN